MTGAQSLLQSAINAGIDTCFANPGTTEMDLVAALDTTPKIRSILALFEGGCTGMADGYGRMLDRPAMTLLHLGVGLGNGIANLHNARRAQTPIINIVGDHPKSHLHYDAPLTSDIATMATPVSHQVITTQSADDASQDMANAIATATTLPGNIVTLITPADTMRNNTEKTATPTAPQTPPALEDDLAKQATTALESNPTTTAIIINGRALRSQGLQIASRIANKTGCALFTPCFPARLDRGAGLPTIPRLPYFPEMVQERLAPYTTLILIGAYTHPVSFFKYQDIPSDLVPQDCTVINLAQRQHDTINALQTLEEATNASKANTTTQTFTLPKAPTGPISRKTYGAAIARSLPENAILSDTASTSSAPIFHATTTAHPHSSLYLTGGGIGQGFPVATGAAIACPDRPVIALQSDGGGLYTLQALWTQAREQLNVTTILFSNRKYQILQTELDRAGITTPGPTATALTQLSNPDLDWCKLAQGFGVPARRPQTAQELQTDIENTIAEPGPHLIEVTID